MKRLIVNADDFGASRGINAGIMEAHLDGILTSASLMVTAPWSAEAARLGRSAPELSVGLHADLGPLRTARNPDLAREWRNELRAQIVRFRELMGHPPTHLDSHHHVHLDPELLSLFVELARDYDVPLRGYSHVSYYSKFYGQWGGQTHLEQVSPAHLEWILKNELQPGITELSCHPGYVDPDFLSSYSSEREAELLTLCHPGIRQVLEEQSIELISFQQLGKTKTGVYA